jgi:uncharacterized lipoprotein YmbA
MMRLFLGAAALLLAGCATTPPPPTLVDTFCLSPASKKRTWNPETDSVEHMRAAVTFNRYIDRRCGFPGKKA